MARKKENKLKEKMRAVDFDIIKMILMLKFHIFVDNARNQNDNSFISSIILVNIWLVAALVIQNVFMKYVCLSIAFLFGIIGGWFFFSQRKLVNNMEKHIKEIDSQNFPKENIAHK